MDTAGYALCRFAQPQITASTSLADLPAFFKAFSDLYSFKSSTPRDFPKKPKNFNKIQRTPTKSKK